MPVADEQLQNPVPVLLWKEKALLYQLDSS